jgi:DNA-binding SARP family transcriptional activator
LAGLVRAHPLGERLRGLLILVLYRSGRQADALTAHQDAKARWADDLGIYRSRAPQQLEKAILQLDPSLDFAGQAVAPVPAPAACPPAPPPAASLGVRWPVPT